MAAPRLPEFRGAQVASGGRITSSALNSFARDPVERTISLAAKDALLRIVYGRTNIPGHLFAQGLIGTDLVLGYVLCIGEIDAVEMVQINDVNAATISGVTVTTYLGTPTQGVDPTLSSAIAAYNDSLRFDVGNGLRGIAYVVLRITSSANVGGWPRMRATIRGRKVYDPRTDTTGYSDNTALCTADLISDLDYGLGLTATNVADVADWCDSLLADGTTKRSRIALVLERPRPILPDWLDLFSSYGEFYWIHEGADIKLVRDSAVDLSATPIEREWIAGTLSVRHEDTADAPRSVDVIYTVPRTDSLPWATDSVRREFAGGAVTPTTLRMEGIVNSVEADNKALAKLNRMQSRVTISCDVPDRGITYQVGDVVRIDSPARGITELPMRVLEVGMSGPGRYRIAGEMYDPSHYPSETPPVQGAQLPAGAIILWDGGDAPSGFSDYTAANGKLLVGAGGSLAQGETGGTGWDVQFSGVTTTDGAHTVSGNVRFHSVRSGGPNSGIGYNPTGDANPAHFHSYDSGVVALNPSRRKQRLIKADIAADNVPSGGKLFGVPGIVGSGWTRDTSSAGRLLEAAAAAANVGSAAQSVAITTGNADDRHLHGSGPFANNTPIDTFPEFNLFAPLTGGSIHSHNVTLQIVANLRRVKVALYQNSADAQLLPGHIVAWEGGALPEDWVLCDGTNGTPDCTDNFVEISAAGGEGATAGDNTATVSATTDQKGHQHRGGDVNDYYVATIVGHQNTVFHDHDISDSAPIDPPYYALAFIMFSPGA